MIFNTFKEWFC